MPTIVRPAHAAACLFMSIACGAASATPEGFLRELPELTGTFVHGQAPIAATVDFGIGFANPLIYLDITATGVPGFSSDTGAFPAELLVSVGAGDVGSGPTNVLGPFGAASTRLITPGSPIFPDIDPPPASYTQFDIVLDTHDIYTGIVTPATLDITRVEILVFDQNIGCDGDINCDGFIGIDDLNTVLVNWNMTVPPADPLADLSGDSFIGIDDLNGVLGNWNAGTPPGVDDDCFNCGFIGIRELNIVLGAWNQNVPPANPEADPSGDGFVGIDDLNWVLSRWNAGTPPTTNAVPEPATIALLGVLSLLPLRRRG